MTLTPNSVPEVPERDEAEGATLPPTASTLPYHAQRQAKPRQPLPPATVARVTNLALPAIVEQVLSAVIGLTDIIVAGHLFATFGYTLASTRAAAGAAVGLMTYLQWFSGLMTGALGVGATAIVARSIGAHRVRVATRVAGTAVSSAFLIGLAVSILLFFGARQIAFVCGLRDLAQDFAVQYLRIMVITVCLQTAAQIGMATLRGAGDTFSPMLIMAAVMFINFFTSSAFTFGWFNLPRWGIRGDAFGTLLAYLTGGIATAFVLLSGRAGIKLQLRHLRIIPHVLKRILRIGLPSWAEGMLLWGGQFVIVIFVLNRADTQGITLAAHTAVLRLESISFLPGFGFGIAASALVGQYLGSNQPDQARRAARIATTMAFVTMTIAALPMIIFPRFMLSLIVNSEPVIATGLWPLILAGIAQPAFAVAIGLSGALKGAGETVWPMVSTLSGIFAVRFPLVLILCLSVFHLGLTGLWIAIVVDLAYRGLINSLVFLRGRWQTKRI